ncbi:DNA-directed RNA polymerase subunit alpha [Candidatus Kuenenbacteria bacterium]|nr:DNA-directed RNA polymerase subunit alpha [Candidatus Kuenenbacteria bacterium]
MQTIPTPSNIEFKKETDFRGDFVIEPLYPGYGLTIGNALRRVLLSSIPGAAISSIKIKGVDHEFSTLPYVKEDIVDIILNLKQVNLKIEGENDNPDEPLKITIRKTGEGKITAGDFDCPSQVVIANKNLHLATLTDKAASFDLECIVENGMGYLPTENRPTGVLDIGHMAIDSIFTPINHVNVKTENVRVGEMTNWDKLIISLETNGTVTCKEAFEMAVSILKNQFDSLVVGAKPPKKEKVEVAVELDKTEPAKGDTIESEELSEDESTEPQAKKKRGRPKKEENK